MRYIDLQESFEREIGVLEDNLNKPSTSAIEYWLNNGVIKFAKTRYAGNNFRRESFEQTQKRIDDLRNLVEQDITVFDTPSTEEYTVSLPENYMHTVGETAVIYSNDDCWPKVNGIPRTKHTDVTESTEETYDKQKENTLSTHRLHNNRANPLRLYRGNDIILSTDGNYYLKSFILTYLRMPIKIDLRTAPFEEYADLPEHTHQEIVKLAAQLYLENQANPRYNSYSNEVNSME